MDHRRLVGFLPHKRWPMDFTDCSLIAPNRCDILRVLVCSSCARPWQTPLGMWIVWAVGMEPCWDFTFLVKILFICNLHTHTHTLASVRAWPSSHPSSSSKAKRDGFQPSRCCFYSIALSTGCVQTQKRNGFRIWLCDPGEYRLCYQQKSKQSGFCARQQQQLPSSPRRGKGHTFIGRLCGFIGRQGDWEEFCEPRNPEH